MCPDIETRVKIDSQIEKFDRAEGLFGYSLAIATRDKKQPGIILSFKSLHDLLFLFSFKKKNHI